MNERLSTAGSGVDSEVTQSLVSLGLLPETVVTLDQLKKADEYHTALARELGDLLNSSTGLMRLGLVGLDQVWYAWNRARGVG